MKYLFYLVIITSGVIKAEYVVVRYEKKQGDNARIVPLGEVKEKVWDVLNTLQFPQNMNRYFLKQNGISKKSQHHSLLSN